MPGPVETQLLLGSPHRSNRVLHRADPQTCCAAGPGSCEGRPQWLSGAHSGRDLGPDHGVTPAASSSSGGTAANSVPGGDVIALMPRSSSRSSVTGPTAS